MILVAHRGAPTRATENTLRSILIGQQMNAQAVEFDIRSTRDGVPVLLHDRTLERFWGRAQSIDTVDLADVRTLTTTFADGEIDRIPTFEEVLDATTMQLILDCKSTAIIPGMVDLLRQRRQFHRAKFIGAATIMAAVRVAVPDAEIVMSWPDGDPPTRDVLDSVKPAAINLEWKDGAAPRVQAMAKLGYPIWVYTVDDARSARDARGAGVSAIISNDLEAIAPGLAD